MNDPISTQSTPCTRVTTMHEKMAYLQSVPIEGLRQKCKDSGISYETFIDGDDYVESLLRHNGDSAPVSPETMEFNLLQCVVSSRQEKQQPLRIIFLDVDGVLNHDGGSSLLHEDSVKLFARLVNDTNAYVVLSSSWRHSLLRKIVLLFRLSRVGMDAKRLVGQTPNVAFYSRDEEILGWLRDATVNAGRVESWVILDDIDFFSSNEEIGERFVWVDAEFGMTDENASDARNVLLCG